MQHTTRKGQVIDLTNLAPAHLEQYREAMQLFEAGVRWTDFESWYIGKGSAVWYRDGLPELGPLPNKEAAESPLFEVLMDLWLRLGVSQGGMAPSKPQT